MIQQLREAQRSCRHPGEVLTESHSGHGGCDAPRDLNVVPPVTRLGEGKSTAGWLGSERGTQMRKFPRRGRPADDDVLTPAEWRTLHAIQHGLSARQVAQRSGISADAVKYHVENIRAKLGMSDTKSLRKRLALAKTSALHEVDMQVNAAISGAGQIARSVRDVQRSERWYRDVLVLPHLYTFGPLAFFECGGVRLMLSQAETIKDESIIYFRTANILKTWEEMKSKEVEFMDAPHLIHTHADGTEEWMVFFKDLEGRPLALMSQVAPK